MNELTAVGFVLAAFVAALLAFASRASQSLVRWRARRLPRSLTARMCEEWVAELDALPGRSSQLAFAIALTLTRRHSFALEDEGLFAAPDRSPVTLATFGGWRSVVVLTTIVMALIAYAASFLIPPLYESRTVVLAVPQRVASRVVEPASIATLDQRLRAISTVVLSRARLEEVILKFNLYGSERGGVTTPQPSQISDAVIERMRRDISVDVHGDQSFEITYVSPDPRMAMKVTERLTSLFVETSLRDREEIGHSALDFLAARIDDVRSRLVKQSNRPSPPDSSEADVRSLEHEILKTTYRDLLMKREHASISSNLERRQIGETFKLLDPARVPEAPISPDRARLTLLGGVVGFCLGMAMMLAGRNDSFRRSKKMLARS